MTTTPGLWWLQPGWTSARCSCGATIWPEGDPDWGACVSCFSESLAYAEAERQHYEELERQRYAEQSTFPSEAKP